MLDVCVLTWTSEQKEHNCFCLFVLFYWRKTCKSWPIDISFAYTHKNARKWRTPCVKLFWIRTEFHATNEAQKTKLIRNSCALVALLQERTIWGRFNFGLIHFHRLIHFRRFRVSFCGHWKFGLIYFLFRLCMHACMHTLCTCVLNKIVDIGIKILLQKQCACVRVCVNMKRAKRSRTRSSNVH